MVICQRRRRRRCCRKNNTYKFLSIFPYHNDMFHNHLDLIYVDWFSKNQETDESDGLIIDGNKRHGSPSTCIGIVRQVIIFALRHCAIIVPCPPACNNGYYLKTSPKIN
ncbi:hypothetical protein DERP_009853 [Dermatophagoides pteronyssinus]|uniref:Uncharacterized protein n=1 Tax=Dermatophagoides pteronyssinus TaxID=6956 RepID=A0ABQ8IRQ1_DERPT|nr:hypothetical protein DERP_009853 [Dermatophagoides pteronyssinus]